MFVYALITPIILVLLLTEIIYCLVTKKDYYRFSDAIANIGTTLGTQCINLIVVALFYRSYTIIFDHFALTTIPETWWSWTLLILGIDFLFYWFHRIGHTINIFWAAHSPHHSSEEFNLSVGLRASFTQRILSFLFYWPLCIVGFTPEMIYMGTGIHLLLGYWHHTRVLGKLGWFEKYFNSPSHHRVHHGINTQYLDKNFAELLIVWDKWFGTFEEEDEAVCYGVTTQLESYDPFDINLQHWRVLWRQTVAAPYFWDKIKLWFMPLGWMPRGLKADSNQKEVGVGMTLDEQVKFSVSNRFPNMKTYLTIHTPLGIGFLYLIINKNIPLTHLDKFWGSVIVFFMIYTWGLILHTDAKARYAEALRLLASGVFLYILNWKFHFWEYPSIVSSVLVFFLGGSLFWNLYFNRPERAQPIFAASS